MTNHITKENFAHLVKKSLGESGTRIVGNTLRRVAREIQWRRDNCIILGQDSVENYQHAISSHETPFFRDLSGVKDELQRNKITNLRIAASRINGRVIQPGERFSFWRHVGNPTAQRGFLEGLVLSQGKLTSGVGGGMCQMTNLLYWITLHTPLDVVERWRHSYDVFPDTKRNQPFGSGATCAYPSLDVQIVNNTNMPFRLRMELTESHLQGQWDSPMPTNTRYRIYETDHEIRNDLPGVYSRHNEIRRETLDLTGQVIFDELITANSAKMIYTPFLSNAPYREGVPAPSAA